MHIFTRCWIVTLYIFEWLKLINICCAIAFATFGYCCESHWSGWYDTNLNWTMHIWSDSKRKKCWNRFGWYFLPLLFSVTLKTTNTHYCFKFQNGNINYGWKNKQNESSYINKLFIHATDSLYWIFSQAINVIAGCVNIFIVHNIKHLKNNCLIVNKTLSFVYHLKC